jgi:hypothetical protein
MFLFNHSGDDSARYCMRGQYMRIEHTLKFFGRCLLREFLEVYSCVVDENSYRRTRQPLSGTNQLGRIIKPGDIMHYAGRLRAKLGAGGR